MPAVIRAPEISPRRVGGVVRLTDVMPTVLELVHIPAPPMDGVSLMDLLTGRQADLELEAYSESEYPRRLGWSPLRALRQGRFKLIDAPRAELYDLERDPFEERNLCDEQRATAESLARRLEALARQYSPTGHAASANRLKSSTTSRSRWAPSATWGRPDRPYSRHPVAAQTRRTASRVGHLF